MLKQGGGVMLSVLVTLAFIGGGVALIVFMGYLGAAILCGLLLALALCLSWVERFIPLDLVVPLPGVLLTSTVAFILLARRCRTLTRPTWTLPSSM